MAARAWWLTVAFSAVLVGCGDDGGGDDGQAGMGGNGGESLCQRIASIRCAAELACCDTPREMATCMSESVDDCNSGLRLDAVAVHPSVNLDQAAADAALSEFESRSMNCDPGVAAWAADGFYAALNGTVASGGDCASASANSTDIAAALLSCQNAATTACLPTSEDNWTCSDRAAAGGTCFSDFNCVDGNYCAAGSTMYDGMCTARKADGETCADDNECTSLLCRGGMCVSDAQSAYCPEP